MSTFYITRLPANCANKSETHAFPLISQMIWYRSEKEFLFEDLFQQCVFGRVTVALPASYIDQRYARLIIMRSRCQVQTVWSSYVWLFFWHEFFLYYLKDYDTTPVTVNLAPGVMRFLTREKIIPHPTTGLAINCPIYNPLC